VYMSCCCFAPVLQCCCFSHLHSVHAALLVVPQQCTVYGLLVGSNVWPVGWIQCETANLSLHNVWLCAILHVGVARLASARLASDLEHHGLTDRAA
jgi:hypothetical protein